jgi:Ser/Thr protein kinase RdoA (MazF antagonist)
MIKLVKNDFLKILTNYTIGEYVSNKHIEFALDNTVHKLNTTKGNYIIKFHSGDRKQLLFQLMILDRLSKAHLPTISVEKNFKGEYLSKYKRKNYFIYKLIKGEHAYTIPKGELRNFGSIIAKIHHSLLDIKGALNPYISQKLKIKGVYSIELTRLTNELKQIDFKKLRTGPIHGDLSNVNILINENKLFLIDWDGAQIDYLVYEISVFISSYLITNKIDYDSIKSFLEGYSSIIKLNDEELKSIYYFVKHRLLGVIKYGYDHKLIGEWLSQKIKDYQLFSKVNPVDFYSKTKIRK